MAVYYYTGAAGGAWSTAGAWTLAGSAGTTGNPGSSDIAVLNVNGITIPNTTTGTIINVNKILGSYPLTGTMTTTATTLTGVGTAFLTELAIGTLVRKSDGTNLGTVTAIASNTSATVTGGATNATPVSAFGGSGTNATVTMNITTNSTYTISAPGGIEGGQIPTVSPSVFVVQGTGNTSTQVNFQCASGNIKGAGTSGGTNTGIKLALTNSNIVISCINLYGGVTASDNYGLQNSGAGNTVTINATGEVSGTTATGVIQSAATGAITVNAVTIKGGASVPGFLITLANSNTQVIAVTDIIPSITCPAICASNTANVGAINTSKLNISGNVKTTGNSSNPIAAIQATNYYLNTSSIKVYDSGLTEQTYTSGTTPPDAKYVLEGIAVGAGFGTLTLPQPANVLTGVNYGVGQYVSPAEQSTGTLDIPNAVAQVVGNIVANLT